MTIKQARKILGKESSQYSDKEILEFIGTARFFADIAIEKIKNGEFMKWKENNKNTEISLQF